MPRLGILLRTVVALVPICGSTLVAQQPGRRPVAPPDAGRRALDLPPEAIIDPAVVPDFSYSGRNSAAEAPPVVSPTTHAYFDVTAYGAVPDDGLSDRTAIQLAIDALELHDGPAVLWFPPGRFVLRDTDDVGAPALRIRRSETVIQGSGMGSGGTELFLASESLDEYAFLFWPVLDPTVGWRGAGTLSDLVELPARGDREVRVEDASGLQPGDIVRLRSVLPDTLTEFRRFFAPLGDDDLIESYFEASCGQGADWRCDFMSTLEIEAVTGDVVRFKEPLQAEYEWTSLTYQGGPQLVQIFADGDEMLFDCGVEDLAFVSNYRDTFHHFFNRAADGYNFLRFQDVRESWVRRVRMRSGTRGIMLEGNGKNNTVHDVLFEGNSGHYSITSAGNLYGNQASFLREEAPTHHGFGATSSAFSTVYHRSNQFGGPEGHGGYPQGTLYDRNAGDLSLSRIGGAPPHQAKHTVFWNWNQSLFLPLHQAVHGNDERYRATSLAGATVDFWPDRIMRPVVVGLHGIPLVLADEEDDFAHVAHTDEAVRPDSLFERQLKQRLGGVPGWLRERARTFEAVTRHSRIDLSSPANDQVFSEGAVVSVEVRLHPDFDRRDLERIELRAARGHDLDFAESVVASSTDADVQSLDWTPPQSGAWRIRLLLVNSLGEETFSEERYVYVEPSGSTESFWAATDGWLQPRSLDARSIAGASNDVVYGDAMQYRADVLAIERPLVESAVDDNANHQVGLDLVDGNLSASATGPAALRWYGIKGLVVDLGDVRDVDFVDLVAPAGSEGRSLFGIFDLQVATLDEAQYSYTNSDHGWRTVRRMGHARISTRLPLGADRSYRIHLPEGTQARYLRLVVRTLDSTHANEGNLSELRAGYHAGP